MSLLLVCSRIRFEKRSSRVRQATGLEMERKDHEMYR